MGAVEEYRKHGGLSVIAQKALQKELSNAANDRAHCLYKAVKALQAGNKEKYIQLLSVAMINAMGDKLSPIYLPALVLVKLPLALEGFDCAETLPFSPLPETFSEQAMLGLSRLIGDSEGYKRSKSAGGIARRRNLESKREEVIAAWKTSSFKSYTAFAKWYFKNNGGKSDENGNTVKNGVPSVRIIAKWIGDYKKSLPSSRKR